MSHDVISKYCSCDQNQQKAGEASAHPHDPSVSGKLTLKIPWKNLYNDAVVASLEGLYLLIVPGASKWRLNTSTLLANHRSDASASSLQLIGCLQVNRAVLSHSWSLFCDGVCVCFIAGSQLKTCPFNGKLLTSEWFWFWYWCLSGLVQCSLIRTMKHDHVTSIDPDMH